MELKFESDINGAAEEIADHKDADMAAVQL